MAVDLYSGVPGSGKSLLATYKIIESLLEHVNVISNFPIDMNYFRKKKRIGKFQYLPTEQITPKYLIEWAEQNHTKTGRKRNQAQTLVVIDECSMIFNSRTWQKADRSDWIFFLANHRHLNFDFVLIAQMDRMIDRQIRGVIETEYKCRAIKAFGLSGKILSLVTGGLFVAVPYNYSAKVKALVPHFFRLHRRKARVYDTMQLFQNMAKGVNPDGKIRQNKQTEDLNSAPTVVQNDETVGKADSVPCPVHCPDMGVQLPGASAS